MSRLDDLALRRVLHGLDGDDEARFLAGDSGADYEELERTVARVHLALLGPPEPLPPALRHELEVQARRCIPRLSPPECP